MLPQLVLGGHGGRGYAVAAVVRCWCDWTRSFCCYSHCSWRSCERDAGDGGWSLNGLLILLCSRGHGFWPYVFCLKLKECFYFLARARARVFAGKDKGECFIFCVGECSVFLFLECSMCLFIFYGILIPFIFRDFPDVLGEFLYYYFIFNFLECYLIFHIFLKSFPSPSFVLSSCSLAIIIF